MHVEPILFIFSVTRCYENMENNNVRVFLKEVDVERDLGVLLDAKLSRSLMLSPRLIRYCVLFADLL